MIGGWGGGNDQDEDQEGDVEETEQWFRCMEKADVQPDTSSYNSFICIHTEG